MRAAGDACRSWRGAVARPLCRPLPAAVTALAASPHPALASIAADDAGGLYTLPALPRSPDAAPAAAQAFFQHGGAVNALAARADEGRMVSASDDESVVHWVWRPDAPAPVPLARHVAHASYVLDAALGGPDQGAAVASVGLDQRLVLTSAAGPTPLAVVRLPEPAHAVAFLPAPHPLLLLTSPATVRLADMRMPRADAPPLPAPPSIERVWRSAGDADDERVAAAAAAAARREGEWRVLSAFGAVGAAPGERFERATGRYETPPAPHAHPLLAALPLPGQLALLTVCRASHLRLWRADSAALLHADDAAPPATPPVRPALADHTLASCHGADVAVRCERAPRLSPPAVVRLGSSFAVTALALALPLGPLLVGDAGGGVRLIEPHAPDGDTDT